AQQELAGFDQTKIDRIIEAMAKAGYENARRLANMAVEETGFGVAEDKVLKNQFATKNVYDYIRSLKTVGIIHEDQAAKVIEIAEPMGVVVGLIPTTNPTSTVMYKALISLKSRNSIVFSPHPRAAKCTLEAARLMEEAAVAAGAPKGVVNCLSICTKEATDELMHHPITAVILATGGSAMVKAAYSAGKPAYGVGPGNVPAFIERSADITQAVTDILNSKTFDNGTICASEQAIIAEEIIAEQVMAELKRQGAYFLSEKETAAMEATVIQPSLGVNPKVVGQSPQVIAKMAGIQIPENTRVIMARLSGVGKKYPLSAEKLCPVLAFYVEPDWQKACERCFELLKYGGIGHTLVIHSQNNDVIMEFALKKPVFRILVNTPSSQGAIGLTTGLAPALTLGCGTWGGSITADNVDPLHLINRKRLAFSLTSTSKPLHMNAQLSNICFTREEVIRTLGEILKTG
ncbi:MAG TPA: acetaldehyde dehydrogenase (acetylating), partial [Bacillota bacterium]|nr:acetaldehyde dehydrogenase (acetylating) [Bacillota bacterium]